LVVVAGVFAQYCGRGIGCCASHCCLQIYLTEKEIKMNAKTVNYSEAQTAEMVKAYSEKPEKETVEFFAKKFGKTVKSVVAKLSREGVYKKAEYVTKKGEKPVQKDSVADAIGAVLKMTEAEVSSLTKANKSALEKIFKALANSVPAEE
jgi:hypothetical protein